MTTTFDRPEDEPVDERDDELDVQEGGDSPEELSSLMEEPIRWADHADGAGAVLLSGTGAGMRVPQPTEGSPSPFTIRTRDEALKSNDPLFVVHYPYRHRDRMPRLLARVVGDTQGKVTAVASAGLPQANNDALSEWFERCAVASIRMADPQGYLMDSKLVRVPEISNRKIGRRPYLGASTLDVSEILHHQRQVGANLLMTSGRALDPASAQASLDDAFVEGDDALAELGVEERLALNLTLSSDWLAKTRLRNRLFAQLLDQEQFDIWHIRVQWPSALRSMHQPTDDDLLAGYKRLSQLAADEGRTLLLPQTGLTGWFQLAFGARGFGTGLFGSLNAFKEQAQGGGGAQQEVERYFEPSLLHAVGRAVHDTMRREKGYVSCLCPYCPALHAKTDWDHNLARLHFMYWQGILTGRTLDPKRTQESVVRNAVRDALQESSGRPLPPVSSPRHLQAWDRLL